MTPSSGVEYTSILPAGHWEFSQAFRFFNSRQDVLGDVPQQHPIIYGNTHVLTLDTAVTYAVTDRFDVSLDTPIQYGSRATYIENDFIKLHTVRAQGLGDIRLTGDFWLFQPKKTSARNLAIGLGVKFPAGDEDSKDDFYRPGGKKERPVDPAIQLGDGGYGLIGSIHGYSSLYFEDFPATKFFENTYAYAEGIYLANPREKNHVQQPVGDLPQFTAGGNPNLVYDSVPDQFHARAGFTQVLWPKIGLAGSFGALFEGVPARDIIGGSEGWRLPGHYVDLEPGISVSYRKNYFSVSVPFAVFRHASRNVPLADLNAPKTNLETIADYQILLSYTHQF